MGMSSKIKRNEVRGEMDSGDDGETKNSRVTRLNLASSDFHKSNQDCMLTALRQVGAHAR